MNVNLTHLLVALWFMLWGFNALGVFAVSMTVLGVIALVAGIAMLVNGFGVDTSYKRGQNCYTYSRMKRLPTVHIPSRLTELKTRFKPDKPEPSPYQPLLLNDDLTDLSLIEVENQIIAVEVRLDKGVLLPEGKDGLKYRLARLQAQLSVLNKDRSVQRNILQLDCLQIGIVTV